MALATDLDYWFDSHTEAPRPPSACLGDSPGTSHRLNSETGTSRANRYDREKPPLPEKQSKTIYENPINSPPLHIYQ